jgi:elongation factor Ts
MLRSAISRKVQAHGRRLNNRRRWTASESNAVWDSNSKGVSAHTRLFASFSMDQLKELRNLSGAPIVDCKKALTDAKGNVDEAMDWLRRHGAAKASSKVQGREAAEGLVACMVSDDGKTASIVKVSSETDFAGKSPAFIGLCIHVAGATLSGSNDGIIEDESTLVALEKNSKSVKTALDEAIVAIRENIGLPFAAKWNVDGNGLLVSYVHNKVDGKHAGSAAALVELSGDAVDRSVLEEVGKKLAMHIVAAKPQYLDPDSVPDDIVEKELEILQARVSRLPFSSPDRYLPRLV